MCDFTTLAITSGILQGVSGMASANEAATQHEQAALVAEKQAQDEYMSGAYKAARITDNVKRTVGQQRAAAAEGGLANTGSVSEVIANTITEGNLDLAAVLWNSHSVMNDKLTEAKIQKSNAGSAKAAAPLAFLSPVLSTAARFPTAFGVA